MNDKEKLIQAIQQEGLNTRDIRRGERDVKAKEKLLMNKPVVDTKNNLQKGLRNVLPKELIPRNVGSYKSTLWPFWFRFKFDFSDGAGGALFSATETKEVTRQISQEAAYVVTKVYRDYDDVGVGGRGAPLTFTLRDRQSSRQLNDEPVSLQHVGEKGEGMQLPVPYTFMPNARLTFEMNSFLGSDLAVANTSGRIDIILFGFRIRNYDAESISKAMFL